MFHPPVNGEYLDQRKQNDDLQSWLVGQPYGSMSCSVCVSEPLPLGVAFCFFFLFISYLLSPMNADEGDLVPFLFLISLVANGCGWDSGDLDLVSCLLLPLLPSRASK